MRSVKYMHVLWHLFVMTGTAIRLFHHSIICLYATKSIKFVLYISLNYEILTGKLFFMKGNNVQCQNK